MAPYRASAEGLLCAAEQAAARAIAIGGHGLTRRANRRRPGFAPVTLNRFESLESLEFSAFFCGALDRNMIRFAI
jgi:hypothetical protein